MTKSRSRFDSSPGRANAENGRQRSGLSRAFRGAPFLASLAFAAAWLLGSPDGAAAETFVERPLSLPPLHVSADIGLGFGQFEAFAPLPDNPLIVRSLGNKVGWGTHLEAAVGVPVLGELGASVGIRFGDLGANAQGDHFGRLFDPIVNEPGFDVASNPEVYLRHTLVQAPPAELGLELRMTFPTASTCAPAGAAETACDVGLTPAVPLRLHIPSILRVDTGLYLPVVWSGAFAIQLPLQVFFQVGDAFFGPLSGIRYDKDGEGPNPRITAGIGGGYTIGERKMIDIKAQVYTEQVNDVNWGKHIGGGIGVGLRLP
jgi:hypothetical protein